MIAKSTMTKFQISSTTGGEMNYLLNITTTNSHDQQFILIGPYLSHDIIFYRNLTEDVLSTSSVGNLQMTMD